MKLFRSGKQRYNFRLVAEDGYNFGITRTADGAIQIGIKIEGSDHIFRLEMSQEEALKLRRSIDDRTVDGRLVISKQTEPDVHTREITARATIGESSCRLSVFRDGVKEYEVVREFDQQAPAEYMQECVIQSLRSLLDDARQLLVAAYRVAIVNRRKRE